MASQAHTVPRALGPSAERELRELGPYAALGSTFASAFTMVLLVGMRRLPERYSLSDLALLSVATHKLSRLLARDRVTRPLRAPFTEVEDGSSSREMKERPRGRGLKHAVGELLSCPFCLDQWLAGAFIGGLVFAPRPTRATAGMFAVVAASDYLQYLQSWLSANT